MSSIEIRLAPVVCNRRAEITNIDARLRELNAQFPGERKKPTSTRNPEYSAQRSEILYRRQVLSGMQHQSRKTLRRFGR